MERLTIVDEYLNYQRQYEEKYGEATIVLMEVGSFFEIYGVETEAEFVGRVSEISSLLGIQKTKKDKKVAIESRRVPLMAGFPNYRINKFLKKLLEHHYTVVLVEQITPAPNPERGVTAVHSPGTYTEEVSNDIVVNMLTCIYIETNLIRGTGRYTLSIGISMIDLTTGENSVYETHAPVHDSSLAMDEAYRFIHMYHPREIVVYFNGESDGPMYTRDDIKHRLDIHNTSYTFYNEIPNSCKSIEYKNEFLGKIFETGMLTPVEYVDLERKPCGLESYILLLRYALEHDEKILLNMGKPKVYSNENHLVLENNTVYQLNVVPDKNRGKREKNDSLLSVLDRTSTGLGRRLLYERILNPITNIGELERRYEILGDFYGDEKWRSFEPLLKDIYDIERLQRKVELSRIHPSEFYNLDVSYNAVEKVFNTMGILDSNTVKNILPNMDLPDEFKRYMSYYHSIFEIDEMMRWNNGEIGSNIFKNGVYPEVDEIWNEICKIKTFFKEMPVILSKYIDEKGCIVVKHENNDRYGHYFALTKKRSETLKTKLLLSKQIQYDGETFDAKDFVYKYQAQKCRMSSRHIQRCSDRLISLLSKLHTISMTCYTDSLKVLSEKWGYIFQKIVSVISRIDLYKSGARVAVENGYNRPTTTTDSSGFVDARGIRHPIIERINVDTAYVKNDICLGKKINGMLLYGVNASGKSSLMKSVGLNIIMAQAGLWVACDSLVYNPYRSLFTRIGNNDNIFRSQSTFEVEMSELRNILKRSNQYSLILGDELCSGTESTSAISIVSAGVITLSKKESSFIFATHLHQLADISAVKSIDNISFNHLSVLYEPSTGKLVYDRKLRNGNGKTIYGLEVCRALDMDDEFLKLADTIRKDIVGDVVASGERTSTYNKKVYVDKCVICGANAVDTHHIEFQCTADKNNMIGSRHKNTKSNLVSLCKSCHVGVHNNEIKIDGWKKTSVGIELEYKKYDLNKTKKPKKYEKHIPLIMKYKGTTTIKRAHELLFKKEGIAVPKGTISKIWKGTYVTVV